MPEEYIVRRIASVQFPGAYLQMDGDGVTHTFPGQGNLTIGHGAGPLDQFKISSPPTDHSQYVTSFESAAYPGVFLRMDATELFRDPRSGGIVNKQFGQAYYELFTIRPQSDGTVAIESIAFPGVYLSLSKGRDPGPTAVINCHFGVRESEKFRLETPPLVPRLRVLSYNTHLMQDSFIHHGIDLARLAVPSPYAVWDDTQRRDLILRNIVNSLADIVALQEVWAHQFLVDLVNQLKPFYPYAFVGDERFITISGFPTAELATSGLLLCSKFKLTDRSFKSFPGMTDWDAYSNKGVLGAVANLPGMAKLRLITAHTTGAVRDIQFIANQISAASAELRALPMITLGDFNISWEKDGGNKEYKEMKEVFAGINVVTDSWIDVHGETIEPDPYTVKMRENTLHQLFSPERDTEKDTRLDYLWVKAGAAAAWSPKTASVPRGEDWLYESPQWHWAHKNAVHRMASAAALDNLMLVVSKHNYNESVMSAVFNGKTWSHYDTGFKASAPPGIVAFEGKFHLFHRHEGSGNAIFHRSSFDGREWSNWVNVGFNTSGGCCPVVFERKLHLLYVDPDGRGGQIFCSVKESEGSDFGPGNWGARKGIGINTRSDISAAVFDNKLYVVCKDNCEVDALSSGLMWSILEKPGENWKPAHPEDLVTTGSPGVVAFQNRLHVYYRHDYAIYRARYDGQKWTEKNENALHDSMVNGVCPVVFGNKLWLFYPYLNTTKTKGGYYRDGIMLHAQFPTVKVDLSDHYPLMVDFEPAMANILVNERGVGDVSFREGEWAGTRGKSIPIDGFRLSSGRPDFKFSYKAYLQGSGETQWINDGEYVGTRGQSRAVGGFTIRLTGPGASSYRLSYRPHVQGYGDGPFRNEGEFCGTSDFSPVEAIYLKLERSL